MAKRMHGVVVAALAGLAGLSAGGCTGLAEKPGWSSSWTLLAHIRFIPDRRVPVGKPVEVVGRVVADNGTHIQVNWKLTYPGGELKGTDTTPVGRNKIKVQLKDLAAGTYTIKLLAVPVSPAGVEDPTRKVEAVEQLRVIEPGKEDGA